MNGLHTCIMFYKFLGLTICCIFFFQDPNYVVAIKSISKKSLAKSQNLLGKEIKILKVQFELFFSLVKCV